jgi:3,4-dihydroxyphenylacetate 2,3-dioxygenase
MGSIVGAAVVCHQPAIMAPREFRENLGHGADTSMIAGFAHLRSAIDATGADTLVIFDTHWVTTVEHIYAGADHYTGIYTSDELPTLITDYTYDYRGAPELARAVESATRERNIPALNCTNTNVAQHYPTLNVLHHLKKDGKVAEQVLSVGMCQTAQGHNFLEFGSALETAVSAAPGRVVLLASGGMSHTFWPLDTIFDHSAYTTDNVRSPEARAMDERIIELWSAGDHASVIDLHDAYLPFNPEGQFGHYLMMVGALGGRSCKARGRKCSDYENAVGTGQVHMWFDL